MRKPLLIAAAAIALVGLSACGPEASDGHVSPTVTNGAGEIVSETPAAEVDPVLKAAAGTWEADYEDVGPHGSTLTINEDGTATLRSFASQTGDFEGQVFLSEGDPQRFEGTEPESGTYIEVELVFDQEADTLTLTYPSEGGTYVHHRS
jgi:hypothetical protein